MDCLSDQKISADYLPKNHKFIYYIKYMSERSSKVGAQVGTRTWVDRAEHKDRISAWRDEVNKVEDKDRIPAWADETVSQPPQISSRQRGEEPTNSINPVSLHAPSTPTTTPRSATPNPSTEPARIPEYTEAHYKSQAETFSKTTSSWLWRMFVTPHNKINYAKNQPRELYLGVAPIDSIEIPKDSSIISIQAPGEADQYFGNKNIQRASVIDAEDYEPINAAALDTGAEQLNKDLNDKTAKGPVYIHCKSGKGRSAAVVAAYLMKYQGKTLDEAIAIVQRDRPIAALKHWWPFGLTTQGKALEAWDKQRPKNDTPKTIEPSAESRATAAAGAAGKVHEDDYTKKDPTAQSSATAAAGGGGGVTAQSAAIASGGGVTHASAATAAAAGGEGKATLKPETLSTISAEDNFQQESTIKNAAAAAATAAAAGGGGGEGEAIESNNLISVRILPDYLNGTSRVLEPFIEPKKRLAAGWFSWLFSPKPSTDEGGGNNIRASLENAHRKGQALLVSSQGDDDGLDKKIKQAQEYIDAIERAQQDINEKKSFIEETLVAKIQEKLSTQIQNTQKELRIMEEHKALAIPQGTPAVAAIAPLKTTKELKEELSKASQKRSELQKNLPIYIRGGDPKWTPVIPSEYKTWSGWSSSWVTSPSPLQKAMAEAAEAGNHLNYPRWKMKHLGDENERNPDFNVFGNPYASIKAAKKEIAQIDAIINRAKTYQKTLETALKIANSKEPEKNDIANEKERLEKQIKSLLNYKVFEEDQAVHREEFLKQNGDAKNEYEAAVFEALENAGKQHVQDPVLEVYRDYLTGDDPETRVGLFIDTISQKLQHPQNLIEAKQQRVSILASMEAAVASHITLTRANQMAHLRNLHKSLSALAELYTKNNANEDIGKLLIKYFKDELTVGDVASLHEKLNRRSASDPEKSILDKIKTDTNFTEIAKASAAAAKIERLQRSIKSQKLQELQALRDAHRAEIEDIQARFDNSIEETDAQIKILAVTQKDLQSRYQLALSSLQTQSASSLDFNIQQNKRQISQLDRNYRTLIQSLQTKYTQKFKQIDLISNEIVKLSSYQSFQALFVPNSFDLQLTRLESNHQLAMNGLESIGDAFKELANTFNLTSTELSKVASDIRDACKHHNWSAELSNVATQATQRALKPVTSLVSSASGSSENPYIKLVKNLLMWAHEHPREAVRLSGNLKHSLEIITGDSKLAMAWKIGSTETMVSDTLRGNRGEIAGATDTSIMPPELIALLYISDFLPNTLQSIQAAVHAASSPVAGAVKSVAENMTLAPNMNTVVALSAAALTGAATAYALPFMSVSMGAAIGISAYGGWQSANNTRAVSQAVRRNPTTEETVNAILDAASYNLPSVLEQVDLVGQNLAIREATKSLGTALSDIREDGSSLEGGFLDAGKSFFRAIIGRPILMVTNALLAFPGRLLNAARLALAGNTTEAGSQISKIPSDIIDGAKHAVGIFTDLGKSIQNIWVGLKRIKPVASNWFTQTKLYFENATSSEIRDRFLGETTPMVASATIGASSITAGVATGGVGATAIGVAGAAGAAFVGYTVRQYFRVINDARYADTRLTVEKQMFLIRLAKIREKMQHQQRMDYLASVFTNQDELKEFLSEKDSNKRSELLQKAVHTKREGMTKEDKNYERMMAEQTESPTTNMLITADTLANPDIWETWAEELAEKLKQEQKAAQKTK